MWVLVVEDATSMGEALRQGLEEDNHTVTLVRDGLEGLHAAETCSIDVIVLDVMLPGLNGIEIARRLRSAGTSRVARKTRTAASRPSSGSPGTCARAHRAGRKPS